MKIQLNSTLSDFLIAIYLIAMLFFRFRIETNFQGNYVVSIFFGAMTLFFVYLLINKKVLNPTYFGLLEKKPLTRQQRKKIKNEELRMKNSLDVEH